MLLCVPIYFKAMRSKVLFLHQVLSRRLWFQLWLNVPLILNRDKFFPGISLFGIYYDHISLLNRVAAYCHIFCLLQDNNAWCWNLVRWLIVSPRFFLKTNLIHPNAYLILHGHLSRSKTKTLIIKPNCFHNVRQLSISQKKPKPF